MSSGCSWETAVVEEAGPGHLHGRSGARVQGAGAKRGAVGGEEAGRARSAPPPPPELLRGSCVPRAPWRKREE
jgi:hypothetical protein